MLFIHTCLVNPSSVIITENSLNVWSLIPFLVTLFFLIFRQTVSCVNCSLPLLWSRQLGRRIHSGRRENQACNRYKPRCNKNRKAEPSRHRSHLRKGFRLPGIIANGRCSHRRSPLVLNSQGQTLTEPLTCVR